MWWVVLLAFNIGEIYNLGLSMREFHCTVSLMPSWVSAPPAVFINLSFAEMLVRKTRSSWSLSSAKHFFLTKLTLQCACFLDKVEFGRMMRYARLDPD